MHEYFEDNVFKLLGENDRPPFRWMLVGPPRSGSRMHQDPLGTSAWNTNIMGLKRWVFFPPSEDIDKSFISG